MQKDPDIFKFILRERLITLTVIGSIFTFAFISSLKEDIIDPLMLFMLPQQNFDFMNVTIREGEKVEYPERQLELRFGNFFRACCTWFLIVITIYVLSKFTSFPDTIEGNISGSAVL